MIYYTQQALAAYPFFGADGQGTPDDVVIIQGNDPLVLEQRVNARGRLEYIQDGRQLAGIQIAGGGKGNVFTVTMVLSSASPDGSLVNHYFTPSDASSGLGAFFFQASSEAELRNQMLKANGRATEFVTGFATPEVRGIEIAGSNDGPEFMGMLLMWRGSQV